MASQRELENIVDTVTEPLQRALAYESLTTLLGEDLQLRYSYCGVATAALQRYLYESHDIVTERMITEPTEAPRHLGERRMAHVVLRHESQLIDPTYSQFMSYVGVTPARVCEHEALRSLYPAPKIAVFYEDNSDAFSDRFAALAHAADQSRVNQPQARRPSIPPDDALRGTSLTEKAVVYRSIWSPGGYQAFPVESQPALRDHITRVSTVLNQFATESTTSL